MGTDAMSLPQTVVSVVKQYFQKSDRVDLSQDTHDSFTSDNRAVCPITLKD